MQTRIAALLDKEWSDALKNRYILFMMILLPLIFVAIPTIMLVVTANVPIKNPQQEISDLPGHWLQTCNAQSLTATECLQVYLSNEFILFFLIMPLAIPMTIATYSVIGEKRDRSLEPLLATPLSTFELLLGKSIAAAASGMAVTWACAVLFVVIARLVVISPKVYAEIITPTWLMIVLMLGPLLTVLATTIGLMVSSRVNDPRAAEQLGMIVIIPVLGLFFGQMAGVVTLSPLLVSFVAAGLVAVDLILLAVAVGLFQRETILTRWK